MTAEYDPENIFAKIIDGTVPCFKVFESRSALAFLDAFPMVPGHTLYVPKVKGYTTFVDMPPAKASNFLRDLQLVAKAVQKATGAAGVNIWQNNGPEAGQTVFHPHFHIVPRYADDKLMNYPSSAKEMLSKDAAEPMMQKISETLNPPKPLKKATFSKVSAVNPDSKGLNLKMKVVEEPTEVPSKTGKFYEVLCADASGSVMLSLRENQKDVATVGKAVEVRNGMVKMVKGHVRVAVDKWGKVEASDDVIEDVEISAAKNISAVEYELV